MRKKQKTSKLYYFIFFKWNKLWIPWSLRDNQHRLSLSLRCVSDLVKMQTVWETLILISLGFVYCDLCSRSEWRFWGFMPFLVGDFGSLKVVPFQDLGFACFAQREKIGYFGHCCWLWRRFRVLDFYWNPIILICTEIRYLVMPPAQIYIWYRFIWFLVQI